MDTCDKERKNLDKYLKWSDAMILVYSVTCSQSFLLIQEYLEQVNESLKRIAEESNEKGDKTPTRLFLLGNKIDMERHRFLNLYDKNIFTINFIQFVLLDKSTSRRWKL